jgi:hypothetical protein
MRCWIIIIFLLLKLGFQYFVIFLIQIRMQSIILTYKENGGALGQYYLIVSNLFLVEKLQNILTRIFTNKREFSDFYVP